MKIWEGEFGKKYTDRNDVKDVQEWDEVYQKTWGITRTEMNTEFLGDLPRDMKVLEVGCNVGNQLRVLQQMGFSRLYGIELQAYAVESARCRTTGINIIQGSAFDIPFKDRFFDLVFTSGVLIHISPGDIHEVLSEIHRCTREYIWGFEYFSEKCTEINYRDHGDLLWKNNFVSLYLEQFKDVSLIKEKKYRYLANDNVDTMFLLRRH
ncbi:MAG: methyltransferase domain-containing protein [Candidatus Lokiarchaeota archaeon]|nr:methyltransferase domain-containing protein [Candidatus Lokiarchaeota archaeon]